jgi:hypothetical protein
MSTQLKYAILLLLFVSFFASGCKKEDGLSSLPNPNLRFDWLYANSPLPLYESRDKVFVFVDSTGAELRLEAESERSIQDFELNGQAYTAERLKTRIFSPGTTDTIINGRALVQYLNGRTKGEVFFLQLEKIDQMFPGRFPGVYFQEPLYDTPIEPGITFTYANRTFADVQIYREGMTENGRILIVGSLKAGIVGFLNRDNDTFYVFDRFEE